MNFGRSNSLLRRNCKRNEIIKLLLPSKNFDGLSWAACACVAGMAHSSSKWLKSAKNSSLIWLQLTILGRFVMIACALYSEFIKLFQAYAQMIIQFYKFCYEFNFWRDFGFRPVWCTQLSWVARVFSTSALQANHFDVTQFTCWNSLETSVLLWLVLREQWFDKFFEILTSFSVKWIHVKSDLTQNHQRSSRIKINPELNWSQEMAWDKNSV